MTALERIPDLTDYFRGPERGLADSRFISIVIGLVAACLSWVASKMSFFQSVLRNVLVGSMINKRSCNSAIRYISRGAQQRCFQKRSRRHDSHRGHPKSMLSSFDPATRDPHNFPLNYAWRDLNRTMLPSWRRVALQVITAYQRYISPRKGFQCPHSLLHGGLSCSADVKEIVLREASFTAVLTETLARFRDCAHAGRVLGEGGPRFKCYVIPCCFPL